MNWFKKRSIIYFLHIYKTAGTSVNDLLFRNYNNNEVLNLYVPFTGTGPEGEFFDVRNHLNIIKSTKIVYGHYAYGIHRINPALPFTYMCFLRDPFDRLVSTYYHHIRMDDESKLKFLNKLNPAFQTREEALLGFPDLPEFLEYAGVHNHQCMFLTGTPAEVIATDQEYYAKMAIENIAREFSFVGLQEGFEESLQRLKNLLKLNTTAYSYKNSGTNKPAEILNEASLRKVVNERSMADTMIYQYIKRTFYSHSVI